MPIARLKTIAQLSILLALLTGAPAACAATEEEPPQLAAGPMPGYSAMRAVAVWLQGTQAGEVTLDYWPEGQPGESLTSGPLALTPEEQYTAQFEIGGLEPGTLYEYRVRINGKPVTLPGRPSFRTQPLWHWRRDPPAFRVITGSCAYINDTDYDRPGKPYGDRYDIFEHIADRTPDMMLWLGDNVYLREADFDSRWGMAERYRHTRALPQLQRLLRGTHHYAIWDDHDYGPNRANRSFQLKDHSLALFKRYWANPAYGLPEQAGNFSKVSFADVDFFLLDNRYQRNSDAAPESADKTMLGRQQLAWLKDALLASRAPFKIIANGSQMLNQFTGKESWRRFPHEHAAFMNWLNETGIPGVLFLSGDAHYSVLSITERNGSYPLYELVCSPLTSGPRRQAFEVDESRPVDGTFVDERNFCQLDFSGAAKARRLTITVFNADGKAMWTRDIDSRELVP